MGINKIGIASIGSITKVKSAIAADGKPIPKNPFTTPERKNANPMKKSVK